MDDFCNCYSSPKVTVHFGTNINAICQDCGGDYMTPEDTYSLRVRQPRRKRVKV